MTDMDWLVWMAFAFEFVMGYLMGRLHGIKTAQRRIEGHERLVERIDPPRRTIGTPTNADAPPAEVRKVRWRSGTFADSGRKEW